MNGKQLKNSILQWAIQGKLVPQDPNDEPASVLLEKIRAEKARLVKEGKLKKKDLEVKPIAEDEIPFEIPKSWAWVKLGDIFELKSGQDFPPEKYNSNQKGIPYITGASNLDGDTIVMNRWTETPSVIAPKGCLLLVCKGSGVGKLCYMSIDKAHIARQIQAIIPLSENVDITYIRIVLESRISEIIQQANGVIPGIAREVALSFAIPLPPLAEQHRIVVKIKELMPLVEKYGAAQDALDGWNKAMPVKLKKSILQEAIQGKLVPQDPADEAAEITLNKYGYVLPKKASKGKEFSQELFDIPDTWTWAPFKKCAKVLYGYPFDSQKFSEVKMGMPMIRIRDVLPGITKTYTTEKADERYIIRKGDMLVGMDGNFNVNYWNGADAYLNQRVCKIVANEQVVLQKYLYYYLPIVFEEISSNVSYCTVKHLADTHFNLMRIPLPPLAEQRRIVAKIEELFGVIK